MRVESSVTSVSWIPREAIEGYTRLPWDLGIAHYDLPPPDVLDDLEGLLTSDAARFANELRAWIEVENGQITDYGQVGRGHIGNTRMRLAGVRLQFWAVPFPDLRPAPEVGDGWVRFVQTAGGRPGMPVPRRVRDRPYLRIVGPTVWSTLALTIRTDGSSDFEVVGASSFPRHWIYDHAGRLAAKTGLIDFHKWHLEASPQHSPWGEEESPAIVTAVESALERQLSRLVIGANPPFRRLRPSESLVKQGEPGDELFLLFDGVLAVEVDGQVITEVGPGAILGEMALLQGGRRTATLRAVTPCRVAVVPGERIDRQALEELAKGRTTDPAAPGGGSSSRSEPA
jgi:Cyclic nucleotide-binding domain